MYFNQRYENQPEELRQALSLFEYRLLYEQIGEKYCILAAPFMAYMLSKDLEKEDRPSVEQPRDVTGITFAMEEFVDVVLNIAMARVGVNTLRVTPQLKMKLVLMLGFASGAMYGFLRVAVIVAR